jgi:DNA primase
MYEVRQARTTLKRLMVVEGYMDVARLHQAGVNYAVATLGTATTGLHVQKLFRQADDVVFSFDGDAAGRKAAWRALEIALPVLADGKAVSFLFLPPEDDPDTYVRREGKPAFLKAVGEAKPLSQYLFAELASQVDMATEEGRARFLAQAKPLLAQIEAPALAAMLRRRLAELARLAPEEIEALVPSRAPLPKSRPAPGRAVRKAAPLESKLLARVLLRPELAAQVPEDALRSGNPESATLREVIRYFGEDVTRTLGQASAYFEGSEFQAPLEESLQDPLLQQADSPDLDLEAEVRELVERLKGEHLARRRTELARLLDAGTATPEQRAEYDELFGRLATAKSGNPSPEARSKF